MKPLALGFAIVLLASPVVVAGELEDAYQTLQQAVAKKDAAQVKKLALEVYPMVCMETSSPAPQSTDEKEVWTSRVAYAKGVGAYLEYALYATAIGGPPATMIDLLSTLEQQTPKSKYLDDVYGAYLLAMNQTGAALKIPAVAEKALENFPENEDLLLVLADSAINRKQADRALAYANRLTAVLNRHTKPEAIPAADWERKRNTGLARGNWIAGVVYGEKSQYVNADKYLRAALPLIQTSPAMLGPALFYLGAANYNLGKQTLNKARVLEGAKFSEQCAAIDSPLAEQARHNALVMKNEAARMR